MLGNLDAAMAGWWPDSGNIITSFAGDHGVRHKEAVLLHVSRGES
jgi:hypothetical protein